ncbi:MAG TPA: hypothetical protein VF041_05790 [Gemmatimonadaceae bacterium]
MGMLSSVDGRRSHEERVVSRLAGQGNSTAEVEGAVAARAAAPRGAALAPRLVVVARSVPDLASRTRRDVEHAGVVILADA